MSNPVLSRMLKQRPVGVAQDQYGRQYQVPMDPAAAQYAAQFPGAMPQYAGAVPQDRMTFDDVLVKSATTIGLMIMVAACTFVLAPDLVVASGLAIVGSVVALVTSLVVSFRKRVGAAGALFFGVVEGVFVGAFSRLFETVYPGIVVQAVLGTFVAAGLTFAAFKFFRIRVGQKLRQGIMIGMLAFIAAMGLNILLHFFGINLGLYDSFGDVSWLGVVFTLIGATLAVFSLLTDFDDINRGIQAGLPATESWRAAFGLTVTMVWLYTNILRILSYLRN